MFGLKFDTSDFDTQKQADDQTVPLNPKYKKQRRRAPSPLRRPRAGVQSESPDEVASREAKRKMVDELEVDLRQEEKSRKRKNQKTYKSNKMRKLADAEARSQAARSGVGTKSSNKESLEALIERMVAENPDVDEAQFRKDVHEEHEKSAVACEKFEKTMEAIVPTYTVVAHYRDTLQRASNSMFGDKRTFISLSKALRRCLTLIDESLKREESRRKNYISLMARMESLARADRRSFSGMGAEQSGTTSSAAVVLYEAAGQQMVESAPQTNNSAPVQFAVPLGRGKGFVELRATEASQVLTGELNESFLECSTARQNHRPIVTETGELARQRQTRSSRKRVSNIRKALEERASVAQVERAAARISGRARQALLCEK